MAWLSLVIEIVSLAIKYGPDLAALVQELLNLIRQSPSHTQTGLLAELEKAIAAYRASGSKKPLIDLLGKVHDLLFPPAAA